MNKSQQVNEIGEFRLIRRLINGKGIRFDDAAEIKSQNPKKRLLITCDCLVEGVHFTKKHPAEELGYKVLAVNISDIAAMAGLPWFAVITVGMPGVLPVKYVNDLYNGLFRCAGEFGVKIAGGDTVVSPGRIFIDLALVGEVEKEKITRRSGAKPGDFLLCTGWLGQAAAGREWFEAGHSSEYRNSVKRFLSPLPRLKEAGIIGGTATSMIDVSDGLSGDLRRLAEESRVGFHLWETRIPVHDETKSRAGKLNRNFLRYALDGGEDYELLFTVPEERVESLIRKIEKDSKVPVSIIGRVIKGKSIVLQDRQGRQRILPDKSYEHFRNNKTH